MKTTPYRKDLKEKPRRLCNNSTPSEIILWNHIKQRKIAGLDFNRQKPVDIYIIDFFNTAYKLGIEIDGEYHNHTQDYDLKREQRLASLGITLFRTTEKEVATNTQGVLLQLTKWCQDQIAKHPIRQLTDAPLAKRGGEKILVDGKKTILLEKPGEYHVSLVHPNSEVTILGAFHTKKSESLSVDLTIHHKAPRTKANTVLKGVAEDTSSIRFFGKIIIDPECGQSNSFLTERILLLSDSARAEAIPELEILTDDVKCSHAASVTSIPEEHVFYLMSRGLSKHQAERLVVDGFLELGE